MHYFTSTVFVRCSILGMKVILSADGYMRTRKQRFANEWRSGGDGVMGQELKVSQR